MKDIWNNIDKLQFKMNSELRVRRTPSNHSLPADIREKLLADQLDIYTLAFHPREYYGELGKDVADECAKNIMWAVDQPQHIEIGELSIWTPF